MKILIWTGAHDIMDGAIKFLTHGRGTHAAFLRADGATVHEAFWPRVRDRALTDEDRTNAGAFELEGLTHRQVLAFEHLFDANLRRGIRYSVLDLFRYALNIPSRDEMHTFCSRYVLHCCHAVLADGHHGESLMPLVRIPDGDWASPRDLLISPRLIPSDFSREIANSAATEVRERKKSVRRRERETWKTSNIEHRTSNIENNYE